MRKTPQQIEHSRPALLGGIEHSGAGMSTHNKPPVVGGKVPKKDRACIGRLGDLFV